MSMTRGTSLAVLHAKRALTFVCALATGVTLLSGARAARHDIHTTHTRAVVENGAVLWKVRLFTDDLEKGLRAYTKRAQFSLEKDPAADSVFTAYFNARVSLRADGRPVPATLVQTGTDRDPVGGTVHWYLLQFDAKKQPTSLTVTNTLLAEIFGNQANIVLVLAMPGELRRSMYFADGDTKAQTVQLK